MNVVKEIKRLNEREANLSTSASGSWHEQYKDSAHIFVGGLPYNLTEGDVICVLSQFGEIAGVNLVRDKETGKSKGFAFIKYVDQRSTVLAVDNMNGSKIGGRVIRVDHVQNYKVPKVFDADGNEIEPDEDTVNNAAPKPIEDDESDVSSSESEVDDAGIDLDDPMREYLLKQRRKGKKDGKSKKSSKRKSGDKDGGETKEERRARRELRKAAKKDKKDKKEKKDKKDKDGSDDGDQDDYRKKNSKDAVLDENKDKVEDKMDIGGIAGSIDNTKKDADQKEQEGSNAKDFGNRSDPPRRSRSRSPPSRRPRSPDRYRLSSYRDRSRDRPRDDRSRNDRSRDDKPRDDRRSREDSRERRRDDSRDRDRYRGNSRDRYSSSRRRRSPSPYSRRRDSDRRSQHRSRSRSHTRSRSPRRL